MTSRIVKVTIGNLGECYCTLREAAGLLAMLKAMEQQDALSGEVAVVEIVSYPADGKIAAIKAVREITGWDLKTAYDRLSGFLPLKLPPIPVSVLSVVERTLREAHVDYRSPGLIERIGMLDGMHKNDTDGAAAVGAKV